MNNINSPFVYSDPVIPPFFAGRTVELDYISKSLLHERESIIIYGNDAIGKSSIISTIYTQITSSENRRILPVRINAFDFIRAIESNFLGAVTHQICAAIWIKIMKRNYSELIEESLLNVRGEHLTSVEEKTIKRIFKIVSNENFTAGGKLNKEIGGKFFVEGKLLQQNELVNQRKELAPFEFLYLLDELNDLIKSFNFDSIIVFCDELNHFPEKTNTEILRNYFNIFSSSKIQFVIISVNPDSSKKNESQKLIESFNCQLEIGTFKSHDEVNELITNSLNSVESNILFEYGSAELIFALANAHPWWIQKICNTAYIETSTNKLNTVTLKSLEKSHDTFKNEIEIYKAKILAGLPFRKYNLIR